MAEGSGTAIRSQRMELPGIGEHGSRTHLRFELDKWHDMETRLTGDASRVVTEMGQPGPGPRAGRMKNRHPRRKGKLKTGWFTGSWVGNVDRCLYHPQTQTAVPLVPGDDVGQFGLPWTIDDEVLVVDIDNADFCIDPSTIDMNHSLDNAELEAAMGDQLRLVLAGNSPPDPSQQLHFKPTTIYMDTRTKQRVAIVGSAEHSNLATITHVLVADITGDRAANIDNIYKAQKEHLQLVRESGRQRHCNVDQLLADIRKVYFPSFAASPEEIRDVLGGYAAAVASQALPTGHSNNAQGSGQRDTFPVDCGPTSKNEHDTERENPAQMTLLLQNQDGQAGENPATAKVLQQLSDIEQEFKRLKLERECTICMDAERSHAFIPCGHLAVCTGCAAKAYESCPMCRQIVQGKVKIYFN